jgi:hypothetical protein
MRVASLVTAAVLVAHPLGAQGRELFDAELRPFIGAYMPAGEQRNSFGTATMLGLQAALELSRWAHFVSNVSWTHGHAKLAALSDDLTYIWQYDAGAEFNLLNEMDGGWVFRPFVGLGVGGRTYAYQATGIGKRTCTAGYAAGGAEFQHVDPALRLESRGYLSCYESPLTGAKRTRNDFALTLGIAYHFR